MGDGSKGSQVFQQTAGYVGIGVGAIKGYGFPVPDAGDLQVLNADSDDGPGITPTDADGNRNNNDAGARTVAPAIRTIVGNNDLTQSVRRIGGNGGIADTVVEVDGTAAAIGDYASAIYRATAIAGATEGREALRLLFTSLFMASISLDTWVLSSDSVWTSAAVVPLEVAAGATGAVFFVQATIKPVAVTAVASNTCLAFIIECFNSFNQLILGMRFDLTGGWFKRFIYIFLFIK